MVIHRARQCEPQTQGAAGRFDDPRTGSQIAAGPAALDHVQGRPILHPARIRSLQFGPEAAPVTGEGFRDAEYGGVPDHGPGPVVAAQSTVAVCTALGMVNGQDIVHGGRSSLREGDA